MLCQHCSTDLNLEGDKNLGGSERKGEKLFHMNMTSHMYMHPWLVVSITETKWALEGPNSVFKLNNGIYRKFYS